MSTPAAERSDPAVPYAPLVFLLLVVATIAAFAVTQRLKRGTPVVKRIAVPLFISPNGDGRKDTARFSFDLPKGDRVTVSILNSAGDEVRRIVDDRRLGRGRHFFTWDGHTSAGRVPPDGFYFVRVLLRDQARAATGPRGIDLVTKPPRPRVVSVSPQRATPGRATPVTIRFSGPANPPPLYSVYRTDQPGPARLVARFAGRRLIHSATWNGLVGGHPAAAGHYAFAVTVENKALVSGSAPRRLPPTAHGARPHTGLTIAGLEALPPLEPVGPGSRAPVTVSGARGRVRWTLARDGARRPLRRGAGSASGLRVAVPSRAPTGLYTLKLSSAGRSAAVPLVVRARTPDQRVLVVLPAISWQGLNPADDDGDGFADTLDGSRSVPLGRPLAFGRLPAGVTSQGAPLLAFLDKQRLRYDLTTDLALARGQVPQAAGHRAVVFAGAARWLPAGLQSRLRGYVSAGGRLAAFGADAFRRTVTVGARALSDPVGPVRANAFGERTATSSIAAAPMVVFGDSLGVFAGTSGIIGLFTQFDQSLALPRGAHAQVAAGRDPRRPAFVAYGLGRGLVVRVGTPQWAARLASDSNVAGATARLWALLSR